SHLPPESAHESAKKWAAHFIGQLGPQDRVGVVHAREAPVLVTQELAADHEIVKEALDLLVPSAGTADLQAAMRTAAALFKADGANRHIVVLTDGQRYGWADESSLARWKLLRSLFDQDPTPAPFVWVVDFGTDRRWNGVYWCLDSIFANRGV